LTCFSKILLQVIQCLDGVVPSKQALQKKGGEGEGETDVNGVEEERRLFFVAASRAKQFLYLTHAKPAEGEKRSRFLEEMVVGSRKDKITTTKKVLLFISSRFASFFLKNQQKEFFHRVQLCIVLVSRIFVRKTERRAGAARVARARRRSKRRSRRQRKRSHVAKACQI
jgi:hypothetical protein